MVTPLVRFEGLAVEFSQHDFGEVLVTFADLQEGAGRQAADTLDPTRKLAPESRTTLADGRAEQRSPATAESLASDAGAAAPLRIFQ